ncbi:unnamed protein product [Cladocopium goreaui]|uniref:Omega-amidase NIT2 (Nitrilase homolog 2) n=1 Tax=Cladocopium goreaui TaxID=2562237 RepID=A0A9P1BJ32_9DINO|nr:unnamed protein product [Cladocopium goreaui]
MSLKIALVQMEQVEDPTTYDKRKQVQHAADLIRGAPDADLYVLPELAPTGYSEHVFDSLDVLAEESNVDALSYQILSQVAKERGCFVCYGVPGKHRESGFTIRQVVLDDSGSLISIYDKIHLCDFGDGRETKWFRPGERLCYFDCHGFRVGVLICADMRHTELSRELALGRSCDILLQPAAFARDVTYASWQSFVECRALENQVYWAAVNYAGPNFGGSMWCPPWVDGKEKVTSRLGIEEMVVVHEASKDELASVRADFPFLRSHRERADYKGP